MSRDTGVRGTLLLEVRVRWLVLAMLGCRTADAPIPPAVVDTDVDTDTGVATDTDVEPTEPPPRPPRQCEEDTAEDNDTLSTAVPWPVNGSNRWIQDGDPDNWIVELAPWSRMTAWVRHPVNQGDIDADLYDGSGRLLVEASTNSDDERVMFGNFQQHAVQLTLSVYLWDFFPPPCGQYDLELQVEALPDCPADTLDDTADTGSSVAMLEEGPLAGLNAHPAAPDRYILDVEAGDVVWVRAQEAASTVGELAVRLSNPAGGLVGEDTFGDVYEVRFVNTGPAGPFVIDVEATDCVEYSISGGVIANPGCTVDTEEPDDTPATARAGVSGATVRASVGPNDSDHHRFQVPAGGVVQVVMAVDFVFGAPTLRLLDAAGSVVMVDDGSDGSYELDWRNPSSLPVDVVVSVDAQVCLDVELRVDVLAPPGCTLADHREPNDTVALAVDLEDATSLRVSGTDVDFFRVDVPANHALNVKIPTDGVFGQPTVRLDDLQGARIALDTAGPQWGVRAHNDSSAAAEWVLSVASGTCMAYDVASWTIGCDADDLVEPNDDRTTAAPVSQAVGALVRPGADDYWAVGSIPAGATVTTTVSFAHLAGDLDIELSLADGTLVYDDFSVTDNEVGSWTNAGSAPADVFLRVAHWPTLGATCRVNRYDVDVDVALP